MKRKNANTAIEAVLTAFSALFMYLASVLPTGQLGFLGAASLCGIAAVIEAGIKGGALVFIASAILGFLLVPTKSIALFYVLFFGYYPILKAFSEKLKSRVLEWAVKLAVFNIVLTLIVFVLKETVFDFGKLGGKYAIIYVVFNAVFIIFDYGVSRVISYYLSVISPRLKRK